MANSIGDWFKRYWILLVLVGLVTLGFILWAVLPAGDKGALKVLKDAEEGVKKLKNKKAKELKVLDEEMDERVGELMEIKAINDEDERLKRLAEFGNRRKRAS